MTVRGWERITFSPALRRLRGDAAERHDLPILTFDFEHFRATRPRRGFRRLVVDESRYAESIDAR